MIDPVEFGKIQAQVEELRKEVDTLRDDIRALLEIAHKGRGALWVILVVGSAIGSLGTLIAKYWIFGK